MSQFQNVSARSLHLSVQGQGKRSARGGLTLGIHGVFRG